MPTKAKARPAGPKIGKYEVHPYRAAVPMMPANLFEALKERTRESGQLYPVTLFTDGRVLDGRAQLKACLELGIEPKTVTTDRNYPASFVIDSMRRTPYSGAQCALIAARLLEPLQAEAAARQRAGTGVGENFAQGRASEIAARAVGHTNEKYVELAAKLCTEQPEIVALIDEGLIRRMTHAERLAGFKPGKRRIAIQRIRDGEEPTLVLRESKPADDLWLTPEDIVIAVRAAFGGEIACDPCSPTTGSNVSAKINYTEIHNGLDDKNPWPDRTFINPPFSKASKWVKRALDERKADRTKRFFFLIPVRPDSDHQADLIKSATDVLLLGERVRFGKPEKTEDGTGRVSIMIAGLGISTQDLVEAGLDGIVVQAAESMTSADWDDIAKWDRELDAMRAEELIHEEPLSPEDEADLRAQGAAYASEREGRLALGRAQMKALKEKTP